MTTAATSHAPSSPPPLPEQANKNIATSKGTRVEKQHLTVENRSDRSLLTKVLQHSLRPLRPRTVKPGKIFPAGSPRLRPNRRAVRDCHVRERLVDGIWVYDITRRTDPREADGVASGDGARGDAGVDATTAEEGMRKRIYYFAGGGWRMPPSCQHWRFVAHLASHVDNATISLISYPLAPNSPVQSSLTQLKKLYQTLLVESSSKGESVIIAGDSSGGNIALALTLWSLKSPENETGTPMAPRAVMAICPTVDLRHVDPKIQDVDKKDPILSIPSIMATSRNWIGSIEENEATASASDKTPPKEGDWSASDPRVSPAVAQLDLLVQHGVLLHGVTGGFDVLGPEAVKFRDRCGELGVEGKWLHWDGQMHCFPLAFSYGIRESQQAVDWMVGVLQGT